MKKAIIIPVYLKFSEPEELPYLEGLKLTKRAIESLKILEDQDFHLILTVCFDQIGGSCGGEAFLKMDGFFRKELRNVGLKRGLVFSSHGLEQLRKHLGEWSFKDVDSLIDLNGFSKIRNTSLLLAQALSMDAVIFIDNDEIIEDPHYLTIAVEYLNQRWNGKVVAGKGGFYVNPDGTILLPPRRPWWKFLWNKTKWMNRVWENILSAKERLVSSSMLLGGNLVLHQHLFQRIPFDPHIPRGEDTDYLINASHFGFCILFDKELRIKHLHPERTETYFHEELKGDIERFLYERQKMKMGLNLHLDPYPGYFLKWTLYPKAILTSLFLSLDYIRRRHWIKAKQCIGNIGLLLQEREKGWLKYLRFKRDWEMVMGKIRKEGMDELLESCRI
ncbi:MAG: hypothetical protein HXY44_03110 [Syntrophaceae bacterium]|nr:hypothetical protein [Syntrophaceae bacterium]